MRYNCPLLKIALLFHLGFFLVQEIAGQTNPTPQNLPYTQNFNTLASGSTSYPDGWIGWSIPTGTATVYNLLPPLSDLGLIASSNASNATGGIHNYNGKVGFLATGTTSAFTLNPSLCLAINTSGLTNVQVNYSVMTIRNPYSASTNNRINEVDLQYRIGTSGNFISVGVTNLTYKNNTVLQTGVVTSPQNVVSRTLVLPAACNNQSIVQLRWVQRDLSGTLGSSRPSFALKFISIGQPPVITGSLTHVTCPGARNGEINLSISGGTAPYSACWDTVNKSGGNIFIVSVATKTAAHPYFGQGFPVGFVVDGIQGKELSLIMGITYSFSISTAGHPFHISTDNVGANSNNLVVDGQSNNAPATSGTLTFKPNTSHITPLYYPCASHQFMGYKINLVSGYCVEDLSGLEPGIYTVFVKDANNLSATGQFTVTTSSPSQEVCNGIDDDCDGLIDDSDPGVIGQQTWHIDSDNDGFGSESDPGILACFQPFNRVSNKNDCNDANTAINPNAIEVCNGYDDNCDGSSDEGCTTTLDLKLFLEGFYSGGGFMTNGINGNGNIAGCLNTTNVNVSPDPLDVDTVFVTLMDPVTRDSMEAAWGILKTSGNLFLSYTSSPGMCYLRVQHRNSLETWSAATVNVAGPSTYDFTLAANSAFGSNLADLGDGNFALFSGDVSDATSATVGVQDGIIESQDYGDMESAVYFTLVGYVAGDITGDGVVESSDYGLMENATYFTRVAMRP